MPFKCHSMPLNAFILLLLHAIQIIRRFLFQLDENQSMGEEINDYDQDEGVEDYVAGDNGEVYEEAYNEDDSQDNDYDDAYDEEREEEEEEEREEEQEEEEEVCEESSESVVEKEEEMEDDRRSDD